MSLPVARRSFHSKLAGRIQEAQCGKLGFTIVTLNMVATIILLVNLIGYRSLSLVCLAVILPSIPLFGVRNYFRYLFKPLQMGIGFAAAWASVKVDEKTGIWKGSFANWAHFHDVRLSRGLQDFFQKENAHSIVDLGCGTGTYVAELRAHNLNCEGYDGNPDTPTFGGPYCKVANLTEPLLLSKKYDWVLSLEVGEHLPKEHEKTFLDNVATYATKGVVLSWAKKGQGGLGHINEQNEEYIQSEMSKRGWIRDKVAEEALRMQTSPYCFWFRNTLMVYRSAQK